MPRGRIALRLASLLAACAPLVACSHRDAAGEPAPAASASAAALGPRAEGPASFAGDPDDARVRALPSTTGEAARASLLAPEDEPALAPFAEKVRAHFAGAAPGRLALQTVRAGGGRVAMLVTGEGGASPLVIVTDETGTRADWVKDTPLAGTHGGGGEPALVSGANGQVGLAFYDAPTHIVALRRWRADGMPFSDSHLLDVDACTALSALYWPGRGHWVVAAEPGFARAQRLDEGGTTPWGRDGRSVFTGVRAGGAVSIALDLDLSIVMALFGWPDGPPLRNEPPHLLVTRFDDAGERLWRAPVDLGAVVDDRARPTVARARLGVVRVTSGTVDAEVSSAGAVTFLR